MNIPYCGECSFLSHEDTDGYGQCTILQREQRCSDRCELTRDRACVWLAEHISPEDIYEYKTDETPTTYLTINLYDNMLDFITAFRQAMKGE